MNKPQRISSVIAFLCLLLAFSACTRDPNVRKQKYLDSGNRYLEAGKVREAGIEFANALKIDPSFAAAHYGLAQVLIKTSAYQGAFQELRKTVELDPNNLKAQLDLGSFLIAASAKNPTALDDARKAAEFVLSKDPNNAQAYSLLSNIAVNQGKPAEAMAQIQKAISLAPQDNSLKLNMGVLQAKQKDYAAAEDTFKKALATDPKSLTGWDFLTKLYAGQQKWPEVEQTLKDAIAANPGVLSLRLELAQFYLSPLQKKNEQAQQVIAEAKKVAGDNQDGRSAIAQFEYASGNSEQAFQDFQSLLNDHPKDYLAKGRYAELLLQKGRDDEASKQLDELLKANPNDVIGRMVRAQLWLKQGKNNDALHLLQALAKDDAKNGLVHHFLGVAYAATGDAGQAEAEWREAVRLDPRLVVSYRALAGIAVAKNDVDLLKTCVEGILKADPTSAEGYMRKASLDFAQKNLPAVDADLQKAIDVAPNNPDVYAGFADWKARQGKLADATKLYEQALTVNPATVRAMQGLVAIYANEKQSDKAKARLKEQIAKSPNTGAYYVMLAALQADGKDYAGAEATLKEGMELDKNNQDGYLLLARIKNATGQVDQAISAYQAYSQKYPKDIRPYLAIGEMETVRNNFDGAKQWYQKALAIEPDSPMANNNLAYMMIERNDNIDQAIQMAQAARRKAPENPNIADTLAYGYIKKGVYTSAVDLLEDAIKKDPNSASVHYHLGLAYQKLNNNSKAREQFQKAAQLAPDTAEGVAAKKELQNLGRG